MCSIFFFLSLFGCGAQSSDKLDDNHGYGFQHDAQGTGGLQLRYSPILSADDPRSDPALYETTYKEVQACTGLQYQQPPFIIIITGFAPANGVLDMGRYYSPNLIVIGVDFIATAPSHEMVHYLLDRVTGDRDFAHASPLFLKCGQITSPSS